MPAVLKRAHQKFQVVNEFRSNIHGQTYRPLGLVELSQIIFLLEGSFRSFAIQAEISSSLGEGIDDDGDDWEAHSL